MGGYRDPRFDAYRLPNLSSLYSRPAPAPVAQPEPEYESSIGNALSNAGGSLWNAARGVLNVGSAAMGLAAGNPNSSYQAGRALLSRLPGDLEEYLPDTTAAYGRSLHSNWDNASDNGREDLSWSQILETAPGPGTVMAEAALPGERASGIERVAKNVGSLGLDMVLDPLNLASGGLGAAATAAKEGRIGLAAARALGSAPAGLAYAPDVIEGTYQSGKQAIEDFGQGNYGAAAEHGSQALLTGGLGVLMGRGIMAEHADAKAMRGLAGEAERRAADEAAIRTNIEQSGVPESDPIDPGFQFPEEPFTAPEQPNLNIWPGEIPQDFRTAPVAPQIDPSATQALPRDLAPILRSQPRVEAPATQQTLPPEAVEPAPIVPKTETMEQPDILPAPEPRAATPDRRLKAQRGANGAVDIEFESPLHKELFSAIGRFKRGMRGEPGIAPNFEGLAQQLGVDTSTAMRMAQDYRAQVMAAVKDLPEGETFSAPKPGQQASAVIPEPNPPGIPDSSNSSTISNSSPEPRYAYRARNVGEQGVTVRPEDHAHGSMSEEDIRRISPSRTEDPQEIIRIDLNKLDPADYAVMDRQPGEAPWVKYNRDLPEDAVERVGDVTDIDRAAVSKAEPPVVAAVVQSDPADLAQVTGMSVAQAQKGVADVVADGNRELSPEAVAIKRAVIANQAEAAAVRPEPAPVSPEPRAEIPPEDGFTAPEEPLSIPYTPPVPERRLVPGEQWLLDRALERGADRNQAMQMIKSGRGREVLREFVRRTEPGQNASLVSPDRQRAPATIRGRLFDENATLARRPDLEAQQIAAMQANPEAAQAFVDSSVAAVERGQERTARRQAGLGDTEGRARTADAPMATPPQAPPTTAPRRLPTPPKDPSGNPILPGQENWTPEERAVVHSAAKAVVGDVVAGQRLQPTGRQPILGGVARNSVEGYIGTNSPKSGTALEGLPYTPSQMEAALQRDKGNPIELDIHEAIRGDERVAEALDGAADDVSFEFGENAPKYATRPAPGQKGLPGVADDVAQARERKAQPEQRSMFGGEMLQGVESRTTEGREGSGKLFTQDADARARAEKDAQGDIKYSVKSNAPDTPEFKRWFGDSKVVDENGAPRTVYHGTSEKFNAFDPDKSAGGGMWFTSDKNAVKAGDVGAAGRGQIVDANLSIKKPAGWAEYDKFSTDELISQGYDGLILPDGDQTTYAVFDPTQIKSASKNRGTYDPTNPDIRYSSQRPSEARNADTGPIASERPSVIRATVQKAFPTGKVGDLEVGGHLVELPNGKLVHVSEVGQIRYNKTAFEKGRGREKVTGEQIIGSWKKMPEGGIIQLTKNAPIEPTILHESFHAAMDMALSDAEKAAVIRRFGSEEAAADAYAKWNPKTQTNSWFSRILQFARRLGEAFTPTHSERVFDKVRSGKAFAKNSTLADMMFEGWKSGLVSAPGTQLANPIANLGEAAVRSVESALAGVIDRALGGERTRFTGEALEQLKGAVLNVPKAAKVFADGIGKLASSEGAIPGKAGGVARIPFAAMELTDGVTGAMNEGALLRSMAFRQAAAEGLSGPARWRRRDELMAKPPEALKAKVLAEVRNRQFKDAGDDPASMIAGLNKLVDRHKWLNIPLPFRSTPGAIAKIAVQRSPLGFKKAFDSYAEYRRALTDGSPKERVAELKGRAVDDIARPLLGTVAMSLFAVYAKSGGMTGSGPTDQREKALLRSTGWQEYSFRVPTPDGNVYVPFTRLEPASVMLGFAADLAEAKDSKTAGDAFEKGLGSFVKNLTSARYLQGLSDAAELINDPKRFASQYVSNLAASAVPNVVRKASQSLDPVVRDTRASDSGPLGIPERIVKSVAAGLPGVSTLLPERKAGTGETIERDGNAVSRFLSPVQITKERSDRALEKLMVEVGASQSAPAKEITIPNTGGRKVRLTTEESQYLQSVDKMVTDQLRKYAERPDFRKMAPDRIKQAIETSYRQAGAAATKRLLADKKFRRRAAEALRSQPNAG